MTIAFYLFLLNLIIAAINSTKIFDTTTLSIRAKSPTRTFAKIPPIIAKVSKPLPKIRSLYERFSFSWVEDLIVKGNNKTLQLDDLWLLAENQQMHNSSELFASTFVAECEKCCYYAGDNILMEFWSSPLTRAIVKM